MHVIFNPRTGIVKDRSHVGVSLPYPLEARRGQGEAQQTDLYFGVGYIDKRDHIIAGRESNITDAELELGVKT